jgi:hypothetical protein
MLALKLGLSLVTTRPMGKWSPDDEASLEAWYQNAVGIGLNGSDVSKWADSSPNGLNMEQGTATEQPAYSNGVLTFVAADTNNLQTVGQITLTGAFTLAFKAQPTSTNIVILADNTSSNEFIKYSTTSRIIVKIGGSTKNMNLDSGTFGDDYIVLTRDGSNLMTLYKNGVAQSGTQTLAGSCLIDNIGVRATDTNPYEGTIEEIQIYSSSSADLTANVNNRLSTL